MGRKNKNKKGTVIPVQSSAISHTHTHLYTHRRSDGIIPTGIMLYIIHIYACTAAQRRCVRNQKVQRTRHNLL